jgi:hypothetical protein
MKNLNLKIFATITPTNKYFNVKGTSFRSLIYSISPIDTFFQIDYAGFLRRLNALDCEKLFIFNITPFGENNVSRINNNYVDSWPISSDNPYFVQHTLPISDFFQKDFLNTIINDKHPKFKDKPIITDSFFIFNNIPWAFVIASFRMLEYQLTQGSASKRGVNSPTKLRLSQYFTCMTSMKNSIIHDSFYNFSPLATQSIFNHTLLDPVQSKNKVKIFFTALEEYFRWKLDVNINDKNFEWDLKDDRKLNDSDLDIPEFIAFFKKYVENLKNIKIYFFF